MTSLGYCLIALVIFGATSAMGGTRSEASIEWLTDASTAIGVYEVVGQSRELETHDQLVLRVRRVRSIKGAPLKSFDYKLNSVGKTNAIDVWKDHRFLLMFGPDEFGKARVEFGVDLTEPLSNWSAMAITHDFRVLKTGKTILSTVEKRHKENPISKPVLRHKDKRSSHVRISHATEAGRALLGPMSSSALVVPADLGAKAERALNAAESSTRPTQH